MFKDRDKFPIYALLYLVALLFFVWGVAAGTYKIFPWKQMYAVSKEISEFLNFDSGVTKTTIEKITLQPLERKTEFDFSGFRVRDSSFQDDGYLLTSEFKGKEKGTIFRLFSIADEKTIHIWEPPFEAILANSPKFNSGDLAPNDGGKVRSNEKERFRPQHPFVDKNGGLYFIVDQGPFVKIDTCGELDWVIDRQFHHSLELDLSGNFLAPIVIEEKKPWLVQNYRDDGFAVISTDGRILEESSVTDILLENGYRGLVYGVGKVEEDRIHLNDAQPIIESKGIAKTGDIALSLRNLSTVLLFRPQSREIVWLKTGPWLSQHDINMLDDGNYSVFGNDIIRILKEKMKLIKEDSSEIYIFDPLEKTVETPFTEIMNKERIASKTRGRLKILSNGDAYIEQTNASRLIRISTDAVRWELVNGITDDTVGELNWSRYIPKDEIDLSWLDGLPCN